MRKQEQRILDEYEFDTSQFIKLSSYKETNNETGPFRKTTKRRNLGENKIKKQEQRILDEYEFDTSQFIKLSSYKKANKKAVSS